MNQRDTVVDAKAMRFWDLFALGRFLVPWHQRNYDWRAKDVQALLDDVKDAIEEQSECYFLGAIILVRGKNQEWQINDGQQRMVTISLICAVLCSHFHREQSEQRERFSLQMLFDLDSTRVCSLDEAENYIPRIDPPSNDRTHYHQIICGNRVGANSLLVRAWKAIDAFFANMELGQLEGYFDFVLEKLEVACLSLPRRIDPNAVYEAINCRGKSLEDFDRIRNYFYSHFNAETDAHKKQLVHTNLEKICLTLSAARKDMSSEYLRCRLQCELGHLQKDRFYQQVRTALRAQGGSDKIFSLVFAISADKDLELFRAITASNPEPDFIEAFKISSGTVESPRNLEVLLRELRGYTVTLPLVFSMLRCYIYESNGNRRRHIARIGNKNLHRLATFVLRTAFVAPKFEPSMFEKKFSRCAREIMTSSDIPNNEFSDFLKGCDREAYGVLEDTAFEGAIADGKITGIRKIKQFLLGVNYRQSDAQLLDEKLFDVEHILPESSKYWDDWPGFRGDGVDERDWVQRIGNLTLLSKKQNSPNPEFNGSFEKKKDVYRESSIALTRDVAKYEDWSPATIEKRQKKLAKRAVKVWTFP